jgi:hypothetical protein
MKVALVLPVLLLTGLTGCDRVNSMLGRGDGGGASGGGKGGDDSASLLGFEGQIDLVAKSNSGGAPTSLSLLVKNDVLRVDIPQDALGGKEATGVTGGGKVYALVRTQEKKAFVVLDAKQQAVVFDLNQAGDQMKRFKRTTPGGPTPSSDPPKVTKTGVKDTVAGYPCENWDVVSSDKAKMTVCVSDNSSSFFRLPLTGIPTESAWALELLDGKHFPLRGVAYDTSQRETGRVEVTKFDKRKLDAAQFEVPAGYKQLSIEEMMAGLGGLPTPDVTPPDVPPVPTAPSHQKPHGGKHHGKK